MIASVPGSAPLLRMVKPGGAGSSRNLSPDTDGWISLREIATLRTDECLLLSPARDSGRLTLRWSHPDVLFREEGNRMLIDPAPDPVVIRAAGGILWRRDSTSPRLLLVHRPKYDDWSLPKGKLEDGESWKDAAIREVREETGCRAEVGEFAGRVCYLVKGRPKIVLFWHMEQVGDCLFEPCKEVDRVVWLTLPEAVVRLGYGEEKLLLEKHGRR